MSERLYRRVPGADGPLPSVTSILDRGYAKPDLVSWAAYECARTAVFDASWRDKPLNDQVTYIKNAAERIKETTAAHGSRIHDALDEWNKGRDLPDHGLHTDALIEWANIYEPEVVLSEFQCANLRDGWAGSGDLVAHVNTGRGRRLFLIDLKTSRSPKHDYRLQLAAYRKAEFLFACVNDLCDEKGCTHDKVNVGPMPKVEGCAILHVPRDKPQNWSFIEVPASAPEYELFRHALAIYRFAKNTNRKPVGTVIEPTAQQEALAA